MSDLEQNIQKEKSGENREQPYRVGDKKPPLEHRFSKDKQPNREGREKAKSTIAKRRAIREEMLNLLHLPYKFSENSGVYKQLVTAFGEKAVKKAMKDGSWQLAYLQMINKSILTADGKSLMDAINQPLGMPKQVQELSGPDGTELFAGKSDAEVMAMVESALQKIK